MTEHNTIAESLEIERRISTASKISMLEERSTATQNQLTRLENVILAHSAEEETMLRNINKSLIDFRETLEQKISDSIQPLKEDVTKYKTVYSVIAAIAVFLFTIATTFQNHIISWFDGK
jgi:archaellum component FlaC